MPKHALTALSSDPVMAKLIKHAGPFNLKPHRLPPFESLTKAIIYQQLSGAAAKSIHGRFIELFGNGKFPSAERVLSTPKRKLRSVGLSRAKAAYILDLAEKARSGFIPSLKLCEKLDDFELIDMLTEVKGIGRWSVEMLLIFNLGRPDVLPVDDLGVRKGFKIAYEKRELPSPKRLMQVGEIWAPYRSIAAWYLWRAVDLEKAGLW